MCLVKRQNTYYFRRRYPVELVHIVGRMEAGRSLKTLERSKAMLRASKLDVLFDILIRNLRRMADKQMQRSDVAKLVKKFMTIRLEAIEQAVVDPDVKINDPSQVEALQGQLMDFARDAVDDMVIGKFGSVRRVAAMLADESGLELDKGSYNYKLLCRQLLNVTANTSKVHADAVGGNYNGLWGAGVMPEAVIMSGEEIETIRLREAVEAFKKQKMLANEWTAKTATETSQKLGVLVRFYGDIPVMEVTAKRANDFHMTLLELPKDFTKSPDDSFKKLIEDNKKRGVDTLAPKTIKDKYISAAKSFFRYLEALDHITKNPFANVKVSVSKKKKDKRKPFEDEDLHILFAKDYTLQSVPQPSHFWIPHMMYYMGSRVAELGQLTVNDIREEDGVWVVDLNEEGLEGANLKNEASRRLVPIHSQLVKAGFLDYVRKIENEGHLQLWPNLQKTTNGYGKAASDWFKRYRLRAKGITDPKKVTYSFRHTMINRLFSADVPEVVINQIVGHTGETMSSKNYNKGQSPRELLTHLERADLPVPESLKVLMK